MKKLIFSTLGIQPNKVDRSGDMFTDEAYNLLIEDFKKMKPMKLYKIKELKWESIGSGIYVAQTIFGNMRIEKLGFSYRFSYCFDEYYDEGSEIFDRGDEAKDYAEKFYKERLEDALEHVYDVTVG